ncbi:hypothetical protein [Nocardioides acrostichi]|nr:hypothetical protein [Nocardioides acrostichi]
MSGSIGAVVPEMVCFLGSAVLRDDATAVVVTDAAGHEVLRSRL